MLRHRLACQDTPPAPPKPSLNVSAAAPAPAAMNLRDTPPQCRLGLLQFRLANRPPPPPPTHTTCPRRRCCCCSHSHSHTDYSTASRCPTSAPSPPRCPTPITPSSQTPPNNYNNLGQYRAGGTGDGEGHSKKRRRNTGISRLM